MNFLEKMGWKAPVLLDGASGTMLQKRGLEVGKCSLTMNLEKPEAVLELHREYIRAGAQAISSNTFAGNIEVLNHYGISGEEREYNLAGMRLARQAVEGTGMKVAGDLGPMGLFQREFDEVKTKAVFTRQAEIMLEAPPDFFLLETFYDLREAVSALFAVKSVAGEIPVIVSMTFNRTKLGFFTLMGNPALFSLKALESAGADAVGSNCSLVPSDMLDLLAEVKDKVSIPLIMQPNAGVPEVVGEEVVYRISSEEYAAGVVKLAGAGAEIVGGCCGSTPEMIGLVAKALRN